MELTSREEILFAAHHDGQTITEIAKRNGCSWQEAHDAICKAWRIEKAQAAHRKAAKQ